MLSETVFNIEDRLRPMVKKALEEQSVGLEITCWAIITATLDNGQGPRPYWGAYYQAKGVMPGEENYVGNMTIFGSPFITQPGIDQGIMEGLAKLRKDRLGGNILGNGQGLS